MEEITMKEITMEKMQELMNNPEFAAKLRSAKTAEEMVRVFAEYDVQVTEEELKESCKKTLEILNEKGYMDGDELSEEALDLVAKKIMTVKEQDGPDAIAGFSSARTVNEDNYLFQKMMRAAIGTNNVDHCARL